MQNSFPKVILISTDIHTLGIQTVAKILFDNLYLEPTMYYLPANIPRYPKSIERKIVNHIISNLDNNRVTLIGFSVKELNRKRTLQLAKAIRKQKFTRNILLVAGGTYATASPNELLPHFDYVVVGNGEGILEIVANIAQDRNESLKRIICMAPSKFSPPLFSDSIWVLDNSGNLKQMRFQPLVHAQYKHAQCLEIMLSTGCNHSCSYCEVSMLRKLFPSYKLRLANIAEMVSLIGKEVATNPKIEYVYFFDEDFLVKPGEQIEKFCTLYKEIRLPFFIFATPLSVLRFPEKLELLTAAGLDTVNMGLQTGSERIAQKIFNRMENREQIFKAMEILMNLYTKQKISSPPMVDFMILNPYEGIEDLENTFHLIKSLPVPFYAVMHSMSFFKGTPLYNKSLQDGKIPPSYEFEYDLHDFISRVKSNEMAIDYRFGKNKRWLLWNILLYGMNGLHHVENRERHFGILTLKDIEGVIKSFESGKLSSLNQLINIARSFPNPMTNVFYPWELKEKLSVLEDNVCTSQVSSLGKMQLSKGLSYTNQKNR